MNNNIIDKRTKGEIHVSHSPITRDKIGRGFEGFGRWRKSIKNQRTVGGKIVANCFGDSKEEAEANAAFIVKACNEYDDLVLGKEYAESEGERISEVARHCQSEYDKLVSQIGLAEIELNHKTTLLTACEDALYKSNQQRELLLESLKDIMLWGKIKNGKFTYTTSDERVNELKELIKKCEPLT